MAFLITKNIIDGDNSYVGDAFWNLWVDNLTEKQRASMLIPFRLLDDDGDVYFEGLTNNSSSFAPLDHFGSGYGCTDIQFFENNKWESL